MKILIVGGTGLISTPLTRSLVARGDSVTLYNRGRSSQEFAGKVNEIHGDRREAAAFEQQMRDAGTFDCVIDMIGFTPEEAESDIRAFAGRCSQFIFCSTVDVYSRPSYHYPYREGEPLHSLSDYGRNKIGCERLFEQAHIDRAFPVTILRPAHTYTDSGAIIHSCGWGSSLLDRMRKGKPILVHGDGQSLWVSAHAEDVARGFIGAIGNTRVYGRGYHLPGEEWLTWDVYHQIVADVLGVSLPEVVHIPTDLLARIAPRHAGVCWPNFQYCNIFDTTAAREELGYRYTIPIRQGFARVVAWLDEHKAIDNSDNEPYYDQIIAAWRGLTQQMTAQILPLGA